MVQLYSSWREETSMERIYVVHKKNGSSKLYWLPKKLLLWKKKSSNTDKIIDWTYVICYPMAQKKNVI